MSPFGNLTKYLLGECILGEMTRQEAAMAESKNEGMVDAPPRTTRQEQAAATRAHIADIALRLFARQGYSATSTRQIAEEAEVSEGAIFHHFPTKHEILRSIPEYRTTFIREAELLVEQSGDASAETFLRALFSRFGELLETERHYVRLLLTESGADPAIDDVFQEMIDRTTSTVAGFLDQRVAAGELRRDLPTQEAARSLLGALLLFLLVDRTGTVAQRRARLSTYFDNVLDIWLDGVRS